MRMHPNRYSYYSCIFPIDPVRRVSVVVAREQRPGQFVDWTPLLPRPTWVQKTCVSFLPGPSRIVPSASDRSSILRHSLGAFASTASLSNISRKHGTLLSGRIVDLASCMAFLSVVGMMPMLLEPWQRLTGIGPARTMPRNVRSGKRPLRLDSETELATRYRRQDSREE
jgi:hypothetical protein